MVQPHNRFAVGGPGFFVRLGNLIVAQCLFVFAALALILFYSPDPDRMAIDVSGQEESVRQVAGHLVSIWETGELDCGSGGSLLNDQSDMAEQFEAIQAAELLTLAPDGALLPVPCTGLFEDSLMAIIPGEIVRAVDTALARSLLHQQPGFLLSSLWTQSTTLYFYRPAIVTETPVLFAGLVKHDLFVSPRHELQYVLVLLFLVSVLLSLLTVHLIWKRFHQPLARLLRGISRTANGEVYYMTEEGEGQDKELSLLSDSMNRMSQNLWQSRQQLKEYNERLRRINMSLLEAQRFMAALIDSSPVGIIVTSLNGEIIVFNREASVAFGYDGAAMLGESIERLFSLSARERQSGVTIPERGQSYEAIGVHCDGKLFPVYVVARPVQDEEGMVCAHIYMIRDISESKNFQDMMIRLDRYYTRGEMAGDIAHEINNYLAVLSGNLELFPLVLKKGDPDKIQAKLDLMRTTVDRIARFADGLMDTNPEEMHCEPSDINQVIENVLAFLKPQNRLDHVVLRTVLSADMSVVELDASKMQQLLVNLVYNAADAIKSLEGERIITVRSSRSSIDGAPAAVVDVCDNGPGVPEERVEQLFRNRFTTKRKGHGIGLITCQRIIEAHHGCLEYRFDGGAVFRFTIPCHQVPTGGETQPAVASVSA